MVPMNPETLYNMDINDWLLTLPKMTHTYPDDKPRPYLCAVCKKGYTHRNSVRDHFYGRKGTIPHETNGCWHKAPFVPWAFHPSCHTKDEKYPVYERTALQKVALLVLDWKPEDEPLNKDGSKASKPGSEEDRDCKNARKDELCQPGACHHWM